MTMSYVFDPPPPSTVAIAGESGRFPVRRIVLPYTPPIRRRCPTAISRAGSRAAATRISISRFQSSFMPRRASSARRMARNGDRSVKLAP